MTGDLAAVLLGVAAAALYVGYLLGRRHARKTQQAEMNRRFTPAASDAAGPGEHSGEAES